MGLGNAGPNLSRTTEPLVTKYEASCPNFSLQLGQGIVMNAELVLAILQLLPVEFQKYTTSMKDLEAMS